MSYTCIYICVSDLHAEGSEGLTILAAATTTYYLQLTCVRKAAKDSRSSWTTTCIYVCANICVHTHMHMHMLVLPSRSVCLCVCTCTCACACHMCTQEDPHTNRGGPMHTHIYICTLAGLHGQQGVRAHTHMCMPMHMSMRMCRYRRTYIPLGGDLYMYICMHDLHG